MIPTDARKIVRALLDPLAKLGLVKITEVGHEGYWEIELLVSPVSEIVHVLGSPSSLPHLPHLPPSQTLPPSAPSGPHPHTPSYAGSTTPAHEGVAGQKSASPNANSGNSRKKKGGEGLELFKAPRYSMATRAMLDFMHVWNGAFVLPKITSLRGREELVKNAMEDPFFRENYREGIKKVAASKFCRGHNRQGTGQTPWKATVEWFLQPKTLPRVLEGWYDDKGTPQLSAEDRTFEQETI